MNKWFKYGLVTMLFIGFATALSSCYKKKDTTAEITVVDLNDEPVVGAEVVVNWENDTASSTPREGLEQTATTDGSGIASFNFNELYKSGQAGVFVLDVEVNGEVYGIIRVEQEETTQETIICENC